MAAPPYPLPPRCATHSSQMFFTGDGEGSLTRLLYKGVWKARGGTGRCGIVAGEQGEKVERVKRRGCRYTSFFFFCLLFRGIFDFLGGRIYCLGASSTISMPCCCSCALRTVFSFLWSSICWRSISLSICSRSASLKDSCRR